MKLILMGEVSSEILFTKPGQSNTTRRTQQCSSNAIIKNMRDDGGGIENSGDIALTGQMRDDSER